MAIGDDLGEGVKEFGVEVGEETPGIAESGILSSSSDETSGVEAVFSLAVFSVAVVAACRPGDGALGVIKGELGPLEVGDSPLTSPVGMEGAPM